MELQELSGDERRLHLHMQTGGSFTAEELQAYLNADVAARHPLLARLRLAWLCRYSRRGVRSLMAGLQEKRQSIRSTEETRLDRGLPVQVPVYRREPFSD